MNTPDDFDDLELDEAAAADVEGGNGFPMPGMDQSSIGRAGASAAGPGSSSGSSSGSAGGSVAASGPVRGPGTPASPAPTRSTFPGRPPRGGASGFTS